MKRASKLLTVLVLGIACIFSCLGVVHAEGESTDVTDLSQYGLTYVSPDKFGNVAYFGYNSPVLDKKDITALLPSKDSYDSNQEYTATIQVTNCNKAIVIFDDGSVYGDERAVSDIIEGTSGRNYMNSVVIPVNKIGMSYTEAVNYFNGLTCYFINKASDSNTYTKVAVKDIVKYASFFDDSKVKTSGSVSKASDTSATLAVSWDFTSIQCTLDTIKVFKNDSIIASKSIDTDKKVQSGSDSITFDVTENGEYSYTLENGAKPYSGTFTVDWITADEPVVPETEEQLGVKASVSLNKDKTIATISVTTKVDADIAIAGVSATSTGKFFEYNVDEDGVYGYTVTTANGGTKSGTVTVKGIAVQQDDAQRDPHTAWGGDGKDTKLAQTGIEIPAYIYIVSVLCLASFAGLFFFRKKRGGVQNEK